MKTRFTTAKKLFAALCVILIIAYASVVFLPHSHDGLDADCTTCLIIKSSLDLLSGLLIFAYISHLVQSFVISLRSYFIIQSGREHTPVGLKVKLSD